MKISKSKSNSAKYIHIKYISATNNTLTVFGHEHWVNQFIVMFKFIDFAVWKKKKKQQQFFFFSFFGGHSWLSQISLKLLLVSYSCSAIIIFFHLLLLGWMCNSLAGTLSIVIDFTKSPSLPNHILIQCCWQSKQCFEETERARAKKTVREIRIQWKFISFVSVTQKRNKC